VPPATDPTLGPPSSVQTLLPRSDPWPPYLDPPTTTLNPCRRPPIPRWALLPVGAPVGRHPLYSCQPVALCLDQRLRQPVALATAPGRPNCTSTARPNCSRRWPSSSIRPARGDLAQIPYFDPICIDMATPPAPGLDTDTVTSAATDVALAALAAAITTLRAAAATSRERVVGVVTVTGALVGTAAARPTLRSTLFSSQPE
jgi:hypothetical protein